jgi:hypothetical protein
MMPKAWYSSIDVRLIRPSRPCCMPRLKRRTATFGDGCAQAPISTSSFGAKGVPGATLTISTSTGTSRRVTQGVSTLRRRRPVSCKIVSGVEDDGMSPQDGHERSKPKLLRAEKDMRLQIPLLRRRIVHVAGDDEHPGGLSTERGQQGSARCARHACIRHKSTYREAKPSDEAMLSLKDIMMLAARQKRTVSN